MINNLDIFHQRIDSKSKMGGVYLVEGIPFKNLVNAFQGASDLQIIVADDSDSIHSLIQKTTMALSEKQLSPALVEAMENLQNMASDKDVRGAQIAFWRVFSEVVDHVLLVDNAAWIAPILKFCYADPISEMHPEGFSLVRGRAFLNTAILEIDTETIDLKESAVQSIKEQLAEPTTIDRIVELVGGDLGRFESILSEQSEPALNLNYYRYLSRSSDEKVLLDILAVHQSSIQPNLLYKCASFLCQSENFTKALKNLIETNLVERRIKNGQVTIQLFDKELSDDILEQMEGDKRTDIHFHLAQSAVHQNLSAATICHHFFEAKNTLGLRFVEDAIQELSGQGELEKSIRFYQQWIALEEDSEKLKTARLGLVQSLEKSGQYERAFELFFDHHDDASRLLKASLLNRLGRFEECLDVLATDSSLEALFHKSEAHFSLGRHPEILNNLEPLLQSQKSDDEGELEYNRKISKARNLIAKVHLANSRFSEAIGFLNENLELATTWGWKREIAQAKTYLGIAALRTERDEEAKLLFEEALAHSYNANDHFPRACLLNMAILSQRSRDYDGALRIGFDAMRDAKRVGDIRVYANAARNVATVYQDLGAFKKAEHILKKLESEEKEDSLGGAWNLFISATLFQDWEDFQQALSFYTRLRSHRLSKNFEPILSIQCARIQNQLGFSSSFDDSKLPKSELFEGFNALRIAEETSDFNEMLEVGRRAMVSLRSVKKESASLYAHLSIIRALRALQKEDLAAGELATLFQRIQLLNTDLSPQYRESFLNKPIFKSILAEAHEMNISIPAFFEAASTKSETSLDRSRFSNFVGEDPSLHKIFRLIDKVAPSDATVLVYGESGTGKELVAEALHNESQRKKKPFVKVNCAALVEDLLLSELFGHEKGAFTGAIQQKIGRFELADGGTIFLDEIGDISPNTQVSLLRVLQEGTFEKVGGTATQKVNVRVVAATNKDLEKLVEQGSFRLDLYYRLKGVVIETPALRNRRGDIGRLAASFVSLVDPNMTIAPAVIQTLSRYSWPGNIRELQNFMQSILLFVDNEVIETRHLEEFKDFFISGSFDYSLPEVDTSYLEESTLETTLIGVPKQVNEDQLEEAIVQRVINQGESLADLKKRLELECIKAALIETAGNVTQAAKILKMKRPRLSQIIGENPDLAALKARLTA